MADTKKQKDKKYHIVYQITNLVNSKIYIGAHSTNDINDGYFGSGFWLNRDLRKFGKSFFEKKILFVFQTLEEMFQKEKELVNVDFLKRKDVYNIVEGGYGGYNRGTTGMKNLYHPITGKRCAVYNDSIEKLLKEGWVLGRNMSSTKNTVWIHQGNKKKMVPKEKLQQFINEGWTKGLPKSPTSGKVWIYNQQLEKYSLCDNDELDNKIAEGWVRKKWPVVPKGFICINNGQEQVRISSNDLEKYLKTGWVKGIIKKC